MRVVLITGSRTWRIPWLVQWVVSQFDCVLVGCARRGADRFARDAARRQGKYLKVLEAPWDSSLKKRAGFVRNLALVHFATWLELEGHVVECHAFHDADSRGTAHCMGAAMKADLNTTIWSTAAA